MIVASSPASLSRTDALSGCCNLLARWRVGDEFLVLLSNTALERALGLAERLRGAVEEESRAWLYPVTISIGVAVYPRHGETVEQLLHAGECAKERAKAEGKNRVCAGDVGAEDN